MFYISGSFLFSKVVDRSYSIMFMINAACLLLAVLYSIFRLKVSVSIKRVELFAVHSSLCLAVHCRYCYINVYAAPQKTHIPFSGRPSPINGPSQRWAAVEFCRTSSTTAT